MRKIKYVLVIFIILLFTGCSGNYNLIINKDLSIDEELNISIENKDNTYETTLSLFERANIDRDKYKVVIMDDEVKIKYKENYSSFEEYYLNSKLYKNLFEDIEFSIDNRGMTINTKSNLKLDDKNSQNIINSYDIDNFKINIKVPFNVNESNADSVKGDTYTWNLNSSDTFKEISIDYSYKADKVYGIVLLSLIGVAIIITIAYIINYLYKNQRI